MPRAAELKAQIEANEHFAVQIRDPMDHEPNANKIINGVAYAITTRGDVKVSDWQAQFAALYPGYSATPLKRDGTPAHGHTLLQNVRNSD